MPDIDQIVAGRVATFVAGFNRGIDDVLGMNARASARDQAPTPGVETNTTDPCPTCGRFTTESTLP